MMSTPIGTAMPMPTFADVGRSLFADTVGGADGEKVGLAAEVEKSLLAAAVAAADDEEVEAVAEADDVEVEIIADNAGREVRAAEVL